MTTLTYTTVSNLTGGSPENIADVATAFNEIKTLVNGSITNGNLSGSAGITDANLASPNNAVYRTLMQSQGVSQGNDVADIWLFVSNSISRDPVNLSTNAVVARYIDDADYSVAGKTTYLRVRGQVNCNGTAPAMNYTFGLYPVTFSGAAGVLTATAGTVVVSSTAVVSGAAEGSNPNSAVSSDFAVPADGMYALGVATSGTVSANAVNLVSAQLQVRNA